MASKKNGRRTSTTRVCFAPDINQRYAELEAELEEAYEEEQKSKGRDPDAANTRKRLAGGTALRSKEIAEQMADLVVKNADSFYELKFEQATRADWLQLRNQHPPRDGNEGDAGLFNGETFPPAAVRLCLIDPEPTDDVLGFFEENLSNGEWERLALQVWLLNEGVREAPKLNGVALQILGGNKTE
jgi:hypothetical protein